MIAPSVAFAADATSLPNNQQISINNPIINDPNAPVDEGNKGVICLQPWGGVNWSNYDPDCQLLVKRIKPKKKPTGFIANNKVEQGASIFFGVSNQTKNTYMLHDSAPWHIEKLDRKGNGTTVYSPIATMATIPLNPGESRSWGLSIYGPNTYSRNAASLEPGNYQVVFTDLDIKLKFKVMKGKVPLIDPPIYPLEGPAIDPGFGQTDSE